jgi:hypothetical protein
MIKYVEWIRQNKSSNEEKQISEKQLIEGERHFVKQSNKMEHQIESCQNCQMLIKMLVHSFFYKCLETLFIGLLSYKVYDWFH